MSFDLIIFIAALFVDLLSISCDVIGLFFRYACEYFLRVVFCDFLVFSTTLFCCVLFDFVVHLKLVRERFAECSYVSKYMKVLCEKYSRFRSGNHWSA